MRTLYSKTVILWVEAGDTIADVKRKLLDAMSFIFTSPRDIRLVSAVRDLEDDRTLGDYNIQSGACLWMLKRLRGGMDDSDGDAMHDLSLEMPEQVEHMSFELQISPTSSS